MTKAALTERLQRVRQQKEALIAQINALIGREAELTELIALLDAEAPVG